LSLKVTFLLLYSYINIISLLKNKTKAKLGLHLLYSWHRPECQTNIDSSNPHNNHIRCTYYYPLQRQMRKSRLRMCHWATRGHTADNRNAEIETTPLGPGALFCLPCHIGVVYLGQGHQPCLACLPLHLFIGCAFFFCHQHFPIFSISVKLF
jgi:hypothetical protein